MNGLIKYSILLLFVLSSLACRSQLSKELPKDFETRLETTVLRPDGSPKWFFRSINISGNQMKVELSRCETVKNVTLDDRTMEDVYQLFVKSEFDLIKDEPATGGGVGEGFQAIYLKAGNISKSVKYGKQFPLSEKASKRFN